MSLIIKYTLFVFCLCNFPLFVSSISYEFYTINNVNDYLNNLIVEPVTLIDKVNERQKRSTDNEDLNHLLNKIIVKIEEWTLILEENEYLSFGDNFKEIWVEENNEISKNNKGKTTCKFYIGSILYEEDSQATVTICDKKHYYGYFTLQGRSFIIEPIGEPFQSHLIYKAKLLHEMLDKGKHDVKDDIITNGGKDGNSENTSQYKGQNNKTDETYTAHEDFKDINVTKDFYKNNNDNKGTKIKVKRDIIETVNIFNLTGDILLEGINYNFTDDIDDLTSKKISESKNEDISKFNNMYDDYDYDLPPRTFIKWHKMKSKSNDYFEDDGYFIDSQWQMTKPISKPKLGSSVSSKTERWLEIALAVDYTVIEFHGKTKIKQYIMALMNIVSAIYKDASLDANLHLVMSRLIFYDSKKDSVIREGNAKKSLEDVNRWNYKLIGRLGPHEKPHDVAVWLTREYLGGPSGYANVAGVCDRRRSTALNKDEGLASAFIIAHEMAHVLGLTHDGDLNAGNKCDQEVSMGTIMAPTVSANFHRFTWSSCSKEEFHRLIKQWNCLLNPPEGKNHTILTPGTTESFTMDEQCRMEYGEGYGLCRNFDLIEPCTYLWCGQKDSLQCITKKGAPAEGTQCGYDKWCVDGYCQYVDGKLYGTGVPRAGGWGQWSEWSKCSRSCGYGVKTRRRTCDNPSPAWGGSDCEGPSEEKQICQQSRQCWESPTSDPRVDRCNLLPKEGRSNGTWLPYDSEDDNDLSCRVSCMLWETGEVIRSMELVPDGTPCTYVNPHHICIDGRCRKMGCDGVENSTASEDECGVCKGRGDTCFKSRLLFNKTQKKNMTRLLVLPRHSRDIRLRVSLNSSVETNRIVPYSLFYLTLRNKHKKLFKIDARNVEDSVGNYKTRSDFLYPTWSTYQVGPSIILAGSAFIAERPPGMLTLSTKGPLHSDVVVMLNSPPEYLFSIEITVEANYTLGKDDVGRYKWLLEENMPCQCGVVPRPLPIYCVDSKRGNRTVHGSHCSRAVKPRSKKQHCDLSCDFHWMPGPWEACTAACGRNGTSHRQLYCVPTSLGPETPVLKLIKFMVEPKYCGKKPLEDQPCNIFPCPAYWEEGPWSACTSVCGPGIQTRPLTCDSPHVDDCGEMPTLRWRSCRNKCSTRQKPDMANCYDDKSPYCALPSLMRYCIVPSYRKLCCFTCKHILGDTIANYI